MAQTRLKSGNLHMVGGDNGSSGNVLKSKGDGTMEWGVGTTPPTFSSVDYPGNDTALDPAGGQSLVINGGGFLAGINIKIGGANAASVTINSASQITIVTPAKAAGTYAIEFTNSDGGNATANSAVSYNGIPAFTNAAGSLGAVSQGAAVNLSVVATEPDGGAITHTITTGALPSGLSLNATTGAITGTAPDVSAPTTTSFSITATDNENQSTVRAYSITINPILPSDDFEVLSYTGNGGTQSITGLSFQPDFVWLKKTNADNEHLLMHPNVGTGEYFRPSYPTQGRLSNTDTITALNSNGFTLGSYSQANANNDSFVAYCWKINGGTKVNNTDGSGSVSTEVNAAKGISVITYSGNASTQTIGHGLGKVPGMFFMMDRYNGGGWRVWHKDLDGPNKYLETGSGGQSTSTTMWNNTLPTSTVFSLGNNVPPNGSGRQHVCWAFASIDGHSKFSSYTGNGANFGPIIDLGFEPALLMIRRIDSGDNWMMFDNQRQTSNPRNQYLQFGGSQAQAQGNIGTGVDFLTNGFIPTTTDGSLNADNGKYIYAAWAQDPDVVSPTLADSFNAIGYSGNGSSDRTISGVGFKPDLLWIKSRTAGEQHYIFDSIRGSSSYLHPNTTAAVGSDASTRLKEFNADGFKVGNELSVNGNNETFISWAWKGNDDEPTIAQDTADVNARAIYTLESNANDVTTNYNATASGITHSSGKFGNAATYSGSQANSGSKIYVSNSVYGASTSVFSVSLWLKCTNTSGEIPIAGNGGTIGGTAGYAVYLEAGKLSLTFRASNGNQVFYGNTTAINDNAWHHIALTCNDGDFVLYLDGEVHVSGSTTYWAGNPTPTFDTYFGNRWNRSEAGVIAGQIDQIRIYDKPLNAASITNLYNETTAQNSTLNIGTKYATSIQSIVNANNNAGMSIVKFKNVSPGSTTRVPHGLSTTPNMILLKRTDGTENWYVYHSGMGTSKFMRLDTDAAQGNTTNLFNTVNSTVFNPSFTNDAGQQLIAYCFRDIAGYQKFGSYTGTGSSTRSFTGVGFQPDFVMVKSATQSGGRWHMYDSTRGVKKRLLANSSGAEYNEASGGSAGLNSFDSDGWTIGNDGHMNGSGATYIYWAIKIN